MTAINWILDRFRERSTKLYALQLIGFLTIIGVVPQDKGRDIENTIGAGQEVYEEVADSVAAKIDYGKGKIEEGKAIIEEAKDTGNRLAQILGGFWVMVTSLFGMGTKDAKKGQEYDAREDKLATALREMGRKPEELLPDLG